MARGSMAVDVLEVGLQTEILNRKEYEAVPMTVDFTGLSNVDVVPAGTPVSLAGVPVKTTPFTGAVGILLHDAEKRHPQVAMLKEGYVKRSVAQTHSGVTYDDALITALGKAGCRIVLE